MPLPPIIGQIWFYTRTSVHNFNIPLSPSASFKNNIAAIGTHAGATKPGPIASREHLGLLNGTIVQFDFGPDRITRQIHNVTPSIAQTGRFSDRALLI